MIATRLAAALGDDVALVVAAAGDPVAAVIDMVRAAASGGPRSVLVVIGGDVAALDRALLRAAIGPLASELAPAIRVNALDVAVIVRDDDVVAAALYLVGACSTTGQLLDVR